MGKRIDMTGAKIGCWTVLKRDPESKNTVKWICRCQCGKEKSITAGHLRDGSSLSCGCAQITPELKKQAAQEVKRLRSSAEKNLIGQKFNRLTVIEKDIEKSNQGKGAYWRCKCDCGNYTTVSTGALEHGTTKSCGCLKMEQIKNLGQSKLKDLTGEKFSLLTVLERVGQDSSGKATYLCKCACGREKIIRGSSLTSGNTKSCGECTHTSFGEIAIQNLLNENNINYQYQKWLPGCIYPDSGRKVYFDFYVDNRYVIEFDGRQHFMTSGGWNDEANYQKTIQHDKFRDEWCKKNNIPLIRIPYTKLETLTFNDIWLPKDNDKNPQDCTIKSVFS